MWLWRCVFDSRTDKCYEEPACLDPGEMLTKLFLFSPSSETSPSRYHKLVDTVMAFMSLCYTYKLHVWNMLVQNRVHSMDMLLLPSDFGCHEMIGNNKEYTNEWQLLSAHRS